MAYTTYEFYRAVYGGTMSKADFCRYAARAGYVLEAMTCDRVKTLYPVCPAGAGAAANPSEDCLGGGPGGTGQPAAAQEPCEELPGHCCGHAGQPASAASTPAAQAIGMAMGAILDGLAQLEQSGGRTVILEAVGKHRVAYAATVQNAARDLRRAATPYLRGVADAFGVPLLYRGALPRQSGRAVREGAAVPPQVAFASAKTTAPMPGASHP